MEDVKVAEERQRISNKRHPYGDACWLAKIFFTWNIPLFYEALKRDMGEEDLFPPLKAHQSKLLGQKVQAAWDHELKTKKVPSLWKVLWKVFKYDVISLGLMRFTIDVILGLSQPIALSKLLQYYQPDSTMTKEDAYLYASILIVGTFLISFCLHNHLLHGFHLGIKLRVACNALIYRKALKLSKSSLAETTIGQMVNLISNDVARLDVITVFIHFLWVYPILIVIIMYLLFVNMGYTAMIGIVFLSLFIPVQMWMGKKTSIYRLRTALRTDERIRLMNEIITGIQVIKMYTWEKPFAKLVETSRKREIQQILRASVITAVTLSFNLILIRGAIYLCVLTYVLLGNSPTTQYVFVTTSFYGILQRYITMGLPLAITSLAETNISIRRIRTFLLHEEIGETKTQVPMLEVGSLKVSNNDKANMPDSNRTTEKIVLRNVSTKWIKSSLDNCLEDISLTIKSEELVAIVGPVGSGKTTLLHVMLQELPPTKGTLNVNGTVSYASQEPWLFTGSIKQNILFGQEYIPYKYQEVIRVCELSRDFSILPFGDRTIVGERGATLSGGQRARINLARVIYKDADIYLLDDPLSAVDTHVGKNLFEGCIAGYLKNKCVVLVTHQLQYLQKVQNIVLMQNGKVEACGTYRELQSSGREFTKLLASTEEEEKEEQENKRRSSRKVSERPDDDINQAEPEQEKETRTSGNISLQVYLTYIRSGGHWCLAFLLFLSFLFSQIFGSLTDYFITFWVNLEEKRAKNEFVSKNSTNNMTEDVEQEFFTEKNCLVIYSVLMCLVVLLTLSRSIGFFGFCMKVSQTLHDNMFRKIVHGSIRFFNINPTGRILNRFSKDMGSIDETLPLTILDTIQIGLIVLGITLVVASVNPWILIPSGIMLTIFYVFRIVFLSYSRDVKRLEATTRSPVFSHLTASLEGLTTIRAFGAQDILIDEFDNYQDAYSGANFMFLAANRTFGFWLEMHCVVYIALVTLGLIFIDTENYGGSVGLAITQSIGLTGMFQWGMRQWSEMENQMTSVERVKEYMDLKPETDEANTEPPKTWPEQGIIKFDNTSLRYSSNEPFVLKNLFFTVNANEKIGIVGRTGAGKSSLIAALFRLTELDGRILIDDIDTTKIPLKCLRSRLSIIPQEPVLFSGTLRKNLDPFDEYSDDALWSALEEVELKNVVADLPKGLESKMSEGGSNFSVGQRQLVCLARAIVRNNKILVLDEATASVDHQTDALIQKTIRRKFAACTVLTIAHRLHTIMDSDKVLVMDAGMVAQFDSPYQLLQDTTGLFYKLVEQTGRTMAENLTRIAEQNYKERLTLTENNING